MKPLINRFSKSLHGWLVLTTAVLSTGAGAATVGPTLADAPLYSTVVVPANVSLALSVEWPTGDDDPYIGTTYTASTPYVGYWSSDWCYTYDTSKNYFTPQAAASSHVCNSGSTNYWSGNFLNWALTDRKSVV